MNRFFLAAFLICLGACGDATGPEPPAGRLLAPGTLALEWSADGAEIYQYGNGRFATWPDRILAVNVSTGATRIVVDSCASGGGGGRPVPPRATIAGLAYLEVCEAGGDATLHLVSATGDSAVAATEGWFTSCPDRTCLIYAVRISTPGHDSIGVIDLPQGTRRWFGIGEYRAHTPTGVSPDGDALLVERTATPGQYAILNLMTGAMQVLPDTILPFPNMGGMPLGWNDDGLWFLAEPRTSLVLYNPGTGAVQRFATGETIGGTRVLTGGSITPNGSAVWTQNCNSYDNLSGLCTAGQYNLWLWNPVIPEDRMLVKYYPTPDLDFPRSVFAAVSPNGQSLAYILGDDVRLIQL